MIGTMSDLVFQTQRLQVRCWRESGLSVLLAV
jgi:hypothetical protein